VGSRAAQAPLRFSLENGFHAEGLMLSLPRLFGWFDA
jgi:hypothetical protein